MSILWRRGLRGAWSEASGIPGGGRAGERIDGEAARPGRIAPAAAGEENLPREGISGWNAHDSRDDRPERGTSGHSR